MLSRVSGLVASAGLLDFDEITFRSKLAARYIRRAQRPNGWFNYEYDFIRGRYRSTDSSVRQAGAGFALGEYLIRRTDDAETRGATERTLLAMVEASVTLGEGMVVSPLGDARSGATALSLLTELSYFEATGDTQFEVIRQAWTQGLLALQLDSGGFRKDPANEEESPYFNGEIWLAIAHYERLFPDNPVTGVMLKKADEYLMARYSQEPDIGFLHWGIMAARARFAHTEQLRFLEFISGQAASAVTKVRPDFNADSNSAYLVEALASAAATLKRASRGSDVLFRALVDRSERELSKCFEMQIMPGQTQIGLREGRYLTDPRIEEMAGALLNRRFSTRTRIDYTQHFLSAMLKYEGIYAPTGDIAS